MPDSERQSREGLDPERVRERLGEGVEEIRRGVNSLFPPEFRQHVRLARREMLLAVRALIDAGLEAIEREDQPPQSRPRTNGRIDVE